MTKFSSALLMSVLLSAAGCSTHKTPTPAKPSTEPTEVHVTTAEIEAAAPKPIPHHEPKYISDFRTAADKRNLDWEVRCEGNYYLATAWSFSTDVNAEWIEEGAVPHWQTTGTTRRDAITNLAQLIRHEGNVIPRHKPRDKNHQCLPPIQGGAGMDAKYADDKCKDCSLVTQ